MFNLRLKILFALFCLLLGAASAQAVPLVPGSYVALPGTTVAAEPQLAGTIIVDELESFEFSAYGGTVKGEVQVRIVRSSVDNTLDFYWRIFNDSVFIDPDKGDIADLRLGNFVSSEYNANYRIDGSGSSGPDSAFLFDFSHPAGTFNFNFSDGLRAKENSRFIFMDTTATNYARTAFYDLTAFGQTESSPMYWTYAPAAPVAPVPEPSTVMLLGCGLAGLVWYGRRRKQV